MSENLAPAPPATPHTSSGSPYLVMLLLFLAGIGLGYVLVKQFPKGETPKQEPKKVATVPAMTLPKDAVQVKECVDRKGSLFVKPQDIFKGPLYIVYQNKVVGLEYVLREEDFVKGNVYDFLPALNMQVDHMTVSKLEKGYDGEPGVYLGVDLFLVKKDVTQSIICPKAEPSSTASPSAALGSDQQATGAGEVTVPLTQSPISPPLNP